LHSLQYLFITKLETFITVKPLAIYKLIIYQISKLSN